MNEWYVSTIFPWLISITFLVAFLASIFSLIPLLRGARRAPIVSLVLVILMICGFLVRFYWTPNIHRIYYDEDRYLSYAASFARFGKAVSVDVATQKESIIGKPDQALRTTVPVFNAWVMKIFGYSELNLFNAAKIMNTLQILFIFILAYLLLKDYLVALFAAFFMAFLPTPVYWSSSIGLDSYFVFFCLLSAAAALWYAKKPHLLSGALTISSIFLLLCVRLEAFAFLPIIVLLATISRKSNKLPIVTKSDTPYILIAALIIIIRALFSLSVLGQKWCCAEALPLEAFSITYFIRNVLPNIITLFSRIEFPFTLSIMAAIVVIARKDWRITTLGLWIAIYFILYSFYYAGLLFTGEFSGSYGRYFLILIPPMVILAGVLFRDIMTSIFSKEKKQKHIYKGLVLLFVLSLLPTIISYTSLVYTSPYFKTVESGPIALHNYLEEKIIAKTPKDSIIIHSISAVPLVSGRDSIALQEFIDNPKTAKYVAQQLKKGKSAYMMQTYYCNSYPKRCEHILNVFGYKPFLKPEKGGLPIETIQLQLLKR